MITIPCTGCHCANCKNYQAEILNLRERINKRNRHISALKSTNETMRGIIASMRAQTTAIFEHDEGGTI